MVERKIIRSLSVTVHFYDVEGTLLYGLFGLVGPFDFFHRRPRGGGKDLFG